MTTVNDLAWLMGIWRGTMGEDRIEETWNVPDMGVMLSTFRWIKDNAVYLYEFQSIEPEKDKLLLRIKHFNANLIGWEDKETSVVFAEEWVKEREIALRQRADKFRRIIYKRVDDALTIDMHMDPAAEQVMSFEYKLHQI